MTVKISSIGLKGLGGYCIQVQVQVTEGKESMVIVGLPDTSMGKHRDGSRVSSLLTLFEICTNFIK